MLIKWVLFVILGTADWGITGPLLLITDWLFSLSWFYTSSWSHRRLLSHGLSTWGKFQIICRLKTWLNVEIMWCSFCALPHFFFSINLHYWSVSSFIYNVLYYNLDNCCIQVPSPTRVSKRCGWFIPFFEVPTSASGQWHSLWIFSASWPKSSRGGIPIVGWLLGLLWKTSFR